MRKQNETNKPKKKQSLQQPKRSCRKIVKLHKKKKKKRWCHWLTKQGCRSAINSNCALCDIQTSSWQGIINLPHNQESDCLNHYMVTKVDLGHYVHKKTYEPCSSNPSLCFILRTILALCSGSKKEKEP